MGPNGELAFQVGLQGSWQAGVTGLVGSDPSTFTC
jgi:hypothetical protein